MRLEVINISMLATYPWSFSCYPEEVMCKLRMVGKVMINCKITEMARIRELGSQKLL